MDTNHSTRTPIPEIYTSSTKYFEVRDKKGYVSRTRKIPDNRKTFFLKSVDDGMKTVFGRGLGTGVVLAQNYSSEAISN